MTDAGYEAALFYQAKAAKRLVDARTARVPAWLWWIYRRLHWWADSRLFSKLAQMDAVILCGTTPNAFRRRSYDVDRLRRATGRPVLYYSVQYLENAPSLVRRLRDQGDHGVEVFDWHLAVSDVTELRGRPRPPWHHIGLYLRSTGLRPVEKSSFLAVVDFARPGFERYRHEQVQVLTDLGIPFLTLDRPYPMAEIRQVYRRASLFFIQFPESFGMPIAECLACGALICTPHSSWPMAWRTDEEPTMHGEGQLPECFLLYQNVEDLRAKVATLRDEYDLKVTPQRVFDSFLETYPERYEGNQEALAAVMERIQSRRLNVETEEGST